MERHCLGQSAISAGFVTATAARAGVGRWCCSACWQMLSYNSISGLWVMGAWNLEMQPLRRVLCSWACWLPPCAPGVGNRGALCTRSQLVS
jgi:hypothetical protein